MLPQVLASRIEPFLSWYGTALAMQLLATLRCFQGPLREVE
jgi:hypothetical protein